MTAHPMYQAVVNSNHIQIQASWPPPTPVHLQAHLDAWGSEITLEPTQPGSSFGVYLSPGINQLQLHYVQGQGPLQLQLDPTVIISDRPIFLTWLPGQKQSWQLEVQCGLLAPREGQVPGWIDESIRIFRPRERVVAEVLRQEGWIVKALPNPDASDQRHADGLLIDQATEASFKVEFKTLDPGSQAIQVKRAVKNALKGQGQAQHIVIDARQSGLSATEAGLGMKLVRRLALGRLKSLRILGATYDYAQGYPYRLKD